jgi:LmbE family N-acetylglucosaminyl deacetylase
MDNATPEVGTLLGVWAHPDDEIYLSAGLMAATRAAGHRVVVATATRGEHGTDDPLEWPPARLAALRVQETAQALAALGVEEHRWLGYVDGALAEASPQLGVDAVTRLFEEVRPDTVVTFGPDGMTGHPDHRTISAWVTTAWQRAGRPCRLWHATVTPDFHREWGEVNAEIGLWFPGATPPSARRADLAHQLRCDEDLLDRKLAALRAHGSQTAPLMELLGIDRFRRWWACESFASAHFPYEHAAVA